MAKLRINRFLADCGLGSRRKVEQLVAEGRIRVNGEMTTDLSRLIDAETDEVRLDGRPLAAETRLFYLMLNKPKGYITTAEDVQNRAIVLDLIPGHFREKGVMPVGRLDRDTEGLLLLTNDGDLAFRLTHPRYEIPKEYIIDLDRPLSERDHARLEKGVRLKEYKTNPARVSPVSESGDTIRMIITEGKKRQIRVSLATLGYRVKRLRRIAFGPVRLTGVNARSYRALRPAEIKALKKSVGLQPGAANFSLK